MGWETRRNGRFYYEARKVGGRTVKTYCSNLYGTADALHKLASIERQKKQLARIVRRGEISDWDALDGEVQAVCEQIGALVDAALTAAGYHRHDRGAWRKKRMATETKIEQIKSGPFVVPEDEAKRHAIIYRGLPETSSNQEKSRAIACLDAYPDEISLATGKSILPILSMMSSDFRPVEQAIREQEAGKMRQELEGENATTLEKMLVERVVACWLTVAFFETQFAKKAKAGGMDASTDDFLQKRIDRAHKRHLSAIKTLAQVRRLQVPLTVQVNVAADGGQQVNVSGAAALPGANNAER